MERSEIHSTSRYNNPTYLCGPSKCPVSREAVWAQNGKLRKLGRTYHHGTYLHQGNIYTQMKLRVLKDQKCSPLLGTKTPLICEGRQNTPLRGRRYGPRTKSCVNWDGPIAMILCLHQGNIYTKRNLRAWRDQKCIPLVDAKTPLTCAGLQNP